MVFDLRMLSVGKDHIMNNFEIELSDIIETMSKLRGFYTDGGRIEKSGDCTEFVFDLYPEYKDSINVFLDGKENRIWSQFRI